MSGEVVPKKNLAKATQKAIVEKYLTACSEGHILRKWMTVKAIAKYINTHLPIENVVVSPANVHESIRRSPQLRHLDFDGQHNREGIYRHSVHTES